MLAYTGGGRPGAGSCSVLFGLLLPSSNVSMAHAHTRSRTCFAARRWPVVHGIAATCRKHSFPRGELPPKPI